VTKEKPMSDHYTYRVLWSQDDGEFIGLCAEFPSLSHLAPDQIEALVGIRALVNDVVADMVQHGEQVPESFAERAYSGRFVTRVPSDLHRRLVIEAAEEGVSLNRLVSNRLASPPMVVLKNPRSPRPSGVKKREYA
jgi:predicted HicB family RNase H-like nuclease